MTIDATAAALAAASTPPAPAVPAPPRPERSPGVVEATASLSLGQSIRVLRRHRCLTLVQLAELAGLSHPFLSQIERDLATPSMGSLERIAHALGSSQLELLAGTPLPEPGRRGPRVVPADAGKRGRYGNGEGRILADGDVRFTPMAFDGANTDPGDLQRHAEDEFITVISGRVLVDLDEEECRLLAPGDSIYYPGGTPHRWSSADGRPYRLFVVKDRPRRARRTRGGMA